MFLGKKKGKKALLRCDAEDNFFTAGRERCASSTGAKMYRRKFRSVPPGSYKTYRATTPLSLSLAADKYPALLPGPWVK